MVTLTKGQEAKIKIHRQEAAELRRRKESKFPNCLELKMFPECDVATLTKLGPTCKSCPYFSLEEYMLNVKKLTLEEQKILYKDAMSEESYERWLKNVESQPIVEKQESVENNTEPKKERVKYIGNVVETVKQCLLKGINDNELILAEMKKVHTDRTEEYLRMRIPGILKYLKVEAKK